jgi:hypothetical protein
MAEIKIKCPVCFDETSCFEEFVEKENLKSYLCFRCGFTSNSFYTKESKERLNQLETTSQLVKDLEFFDDDRQIYWYPSIVNMGPKGIIFPEGNVDQWDWKYAEVVEIPKEEQEQYPIPDKDGEFYTEKLDVENAQTFGQYDFLEACKKMGITMEVPNV